MVHNSKNSMESHCNKIKKTYYVNLLQIYKTRNEINVTKP